MRGHPRGEEEEEEGEVLDGPKIEELWHVGNVPEGRGCSRWARLDPNPSKRCRGGSKRAPGAQEERVQDTPKPPQIGFFHFFSRNQHQWNHGNNQDIWKNDQTWDHQNHWDPYS